MTEIGEVVNNMMKQSFPSIVDVHFTANMEGLLDMVEEGKVHVERQSSVISTRIWTKLCRKQKKSWRV